METTESKSSLASVKGSRQTLRVVLSKDVKAEAIHRSLDEVFKELGCTGCGLGGIDLRFIREELVLPRQLEQFKHIAGIKEAAFNL